MLIKLIVNWVIEEFCRDKIIKSKAVQNIKKRNSAKHFSSNKQFFLKAMGSISHCLGMLVNAESSILCACTHLHIHPHPQRELRKPYPLALLQYCHMTW